MLAHSYAAATGIGDVLRVAAFAKQDKRDHHAPVVMYVEEYATGVPYATRALQNLRFVDRVVQCLRHKQHPLPTEAFKEGWFQRTPPSDGLTLEPTDLRWIGLPESLERLLPDRFTLVQPQTTRFKQQRRLTRWPSDFAIIAVGSADDRSALPELGRYFADKLDPAFSAQMVLDWRGQLTVEETMYLTTLADRVVGVESWVSTLGAMLGIPSEMEISKYVWERQGEHFRQCFPTMTWHVVEAESGIIEPTIPTRRPVHPAIQSLLLKTAG